MQTLLYLCRANMSDDYFTRRRDRYFAINNIPSLCDYFEQLVTAVCNHSFYLSSSQNQVMGSHTFFCKFNLGFYFILFNSKQNLKFKSIAVLWVYGFSSYIFILWYSFSSWWWLRYYYYYCCCCCCCCCGYSQHHPRLSHRRSIHLCTALPSRLRSFVLFHPFLSHQLV